MKWAQHIEQASGGAAVIDILVTDFAVVDEQVNILARPMSFITSLSILRKMLRAEWLGSLKNGTCYG